MCLSFSFILPSYPHFCVPSSVSYSNVLSSCTFLSFVLPLLFSLPQFLSFLFLPSTQSLFNLHRHSLSYTTPLQHTQSFCNFPSTFCKTQHFFKIYLLIMLLQLFHFLPPSLHSILPTSSLPHSPPIVHVHGSYL